MEFKYVNKCSLDSSDYDKILGLEELLEKEQVEVKLELEYKKMCSEAKTVSHSDCIASDEDQVTNAREYLCYLGEQLVGYLGLCDFDGRTIEVNGLVHPKYRRLGIFTNLMDRFLSSRKDGPFKEILLLSDSRSQSGLAFISKYTNNLDHCEYEMYLDKNKSIKASAVNLFLRLASNKDSYEIDVQNSIYFHPENDEITLNEINPEDEINKGFYIYLAEVQGQTIGKVNIQYSDLESGIYGLGVKPEFRSKGYGRAILLKAIKLIEEKSSGHIMLQVEVENENALKLYKSCGFYVTYAMNYFKYQ